MTLHSANARLIDHEALNDTPNSLTLAEGLIQSIRTPAPHNAAIIACHGVPPGIVGLGKPCARHKDSGKFTAQTTAGVMA